MTRSFHPGRRQLQEIKKEAQEEELKPVKDTAKREAFAEASSEAAGEASTEAPKGASEEASTEDEFKAQRERTEKEEKSEDETKDKEDPTPPPPHGDKTPWQVFLDTMQSELKQSKEWNESTKALAEGAHQFTESESVQRARKAYEATSDAVSSTAANVLKSTATAVGKGATWTWETPVMKGVRKGANVTGEVLDKATKPIRETEAFKNVKDVIDDGSSSRYGGWVEKEERRKRRELREKLDQGTGGIPQVHNEDPESVFFFSPFLSFILLVLFLPLY